METKQKKFILLFALLYNIIHISLYNSKTIIHVYSPGGYTQLQDLSDLQDDVPDVFRTTIIKIKGR